MRIAYIVPSLQKLGPVVVVFELVRQMLAKGHDTTVFYFDDKQNNIIDFPCHSQKIQFKEKFNFDSFDVIHTHGLRPDAYIWYHRKKTDKAKFVSTIHCFVFEDLKMTYNLFIAIVFTPVWIYLLRKTDLRVVLSKQALNYYKRWFGKLKTIYIYNSRTVDYHGILSTEERKEILDFKGTDIILGVNAILTPIKAIDVIITSMAFINGVRLFIAGDGKSRTSLEQLVKDRNLTDRVYFAGYRENAYRYIPYYNIYMMPSRSEGFPLALLEAMSLKCNAVISDIPIFKEFFTDKEVTFFKLGDAKDCAKAIEYAISHNKGEQAYHKYVTEYSPEIFGNKYLEIYKN